MPNNRIDFPGIKYANPFLVPEYNQPLDGKRILPDSNRPHLYGTNATEYKIGIGIDGKEIQIPRVVGGQLLSNEGAVERYKLTGESFGTMKNPSAYSKFYDQLEKLGIMMKPRRVIKRQQGGILYNPKDREAIIAARTARDIQRSQDWADAEYKHNYPIRSAITDVLDEIALTPQAMYDWKLLYNKEYNEYSRKNNSISNILISGATDAAIDMSGRLIGKGISKLVSGYPTTGLKEVPTRRPIEPRTGIRLEYGGSKPYIIDLGDDIPITSIKRNMLIDAPSTVKTQVNGLGRFRDLSGGGALYVGINNMINNIINKQNR